MANTFSAPSTYFVLIRDEDSHYRAADGTYVTKLAQAQKFPTEAQAEAHRNLLTEYVVGVADLKEKTQS